MRPGHRALLAALLTAIVALAIWHVVVQRIESANIDHERHAVEADLIRYGDAVAIAINQRVNLLNGLQTYTELMVAQHGYINQDELRAYAAGLYENVTGLRGFAIAPDGVYHFVYPFEMNAGMLGLDMEQAGLGSLVDQATDANNPVMSSPYYPPGHNLAVTVILPVASNREHWGFVSANIDLNSTLQEVPVSADMVAAFYDESGNRFYGPAVGDDPVTYCAAIGNACWELRGAPREGWGRPDDTQQWFRYSGLAIVGLVTVLGYQVVGRQARLRLAVEQRTQAMALRTALNQAMMHAADEHSLVQDVCDLLAAPYDGVSIWLDDHGASAQAGDEPRLEKSLIQTTLHTSTIRVDASGMALPLTAGGITLGALCVGHGPFDPDDEQQLRDLAADVAFALAGFRSRQAHISTDTALRQSEQHYRTLFDSANDAIFVYGLDGRFVDVNAVACERLGYSRQQLLTMTPDDFRPPGAPPRAANWIERMLADKSAIAESVHVRSDGTPIPVEISSRLITFRGQQAILSIARDITDRKQAEQELRASEARNRLIIENSADGILIISLEGYVQFMNPAAEALLGRSLIGSFFGFPLADNAETEITLRRPDGETLVCDMRVVQTHWQSQTVYLASLRDITAQQEAAQRRLELRLERERMQIMTDFIRNAGHQFRTPLSTIQTNLSLLNLVEDPAERVRLLEKIDEKTQVILALVNALVRLSRLDGSEALGKAPLNLNGVIHDVAVHFKGQPITLQLADELPDISGDAAELHFALEELVGNALRFSPEGGPVTLWTGLEGDCVVTEVRDTGIGMDDETQARIFERFFRADPSQDADGLGLGLPTVQKIVQAHNGHISVQSAPGVGTTFRVTLPL